MADEKDSKAALDGAARAASYNVVLQVIVRISSFALNGFILRYISGELLGVVNLRLTLLYTTLLFVSREALRRACLSKIEQQVSWQQRFNLLWCSIPVCVLASVLLGTLWLSRLLEQPSTGLYWVGVVSFSLSALIELIAEPLCMLGHSFHFSSLRILAEGLGQVFKVGAVVLGIVIFPNMGILVFCISQIIFSCTYVAVYFIYFNSQFRHKTAPQLPIATMKGIFPKFSYDKEPVLNPHLLTLSWSFLKQSLLKQLLTDGEKYVMTIFGILNFTQQGIYDVINNLGSLVARFIFQPIEESFYIFFSQTLKRGLPVEKQSEESVTLSLTTLTMLIKAVLWISLIILIFGFSYSHLALNIYGGKTLTDSDGPLLMKCYCIYVLALGINGITECFFFALMSKSEGDRYNRKLLWFSFIFLVSAILLTRILGSAGFILANCVNMITRIWNSCNFMLTFYKLTPQELVKKCQPSSNFLITCLMVFLLTVMSEMWLYASGHVFLHLIIGAGCGVLVLLITRSHEREMCHFFIERLPIRLQHIVKQFIL